MTSEEKLKHFEDSVIGRANELSREMLKEYQESLNKEEEAYQAEKNQQALSKIKTEIERLKRDVNTTLAREQMNIKRQLTKRAQELTEQLFEEVRGKLKEYRKTGEYEKLLAKQIRGIQKIAGDRELKIFISPLDQGLCSALKEETKADVQTAEDSFLGGVRGYVDHGRILVDNSFDAKLAELRENFTFEGGTSHE